MAEQVFPTKGNLINTKKSLDLAKVGFELLDRKRNVLMREMMKLIDESAKLQQDIGDTFSSAYKALQAANVTLGIDQIISPNRCRWKTVYPFLPAASWGWKSPWCGAFRPRPWTRA